jgi:hypothetical protein
MKKKLSRFLAVALVALSPGMLWAEMSAQDSVALQEYLDSVGVSMSDLEAKVQSTLMFGGSAPVSFSGEGRFKLQFHEYVNSPKWSESDKSWLQSNWEGNESAIRIGMVARAGRNTVLWSKIGFQNTLPGFHRSSSAYYENGEFQPQGLHHKDGTAAIIHEDMNAGIAIRTVPASFWLKMGAIQWIEASPLTIWKSQPRTFAWEYLPFEVEQPIARYFEYNIAKGEKSGRAAWNKKAFQGINLESINLPGNLYFNFLYSTYERYDNFEREYIDFSGDYGLADDPLMKGLGIGDSYRHLFHARLAAKELLGRVTPSLNFMGYNYDNEIFKLRSAKPDKNSLWKVFGNKTLLPVRGDKAFIKEPIVSSFELRGPINEKLSIHTDLAIGATDTTWWRYDSVGVDTAGAALSGWQKTSNWTSLKAAFYARIENKYVVPLNIDVACIGRGFYSPLSFAPPVDAFFPYGANLLGPGKFLARGEASPYVSNMAGVNLQFAPTLSGYGHFKANYGQHFQLEKARDLICFPYRLNGQDMNSFYQSSYNRWGNDAIDISTIELAKAKYTQRMGDETYKTSAYKSPYGFESGGLRSDYLGMYEGFVAYEDVDQAQANIENLDNSTVFWKNKKTGGDTYSYVKKTYAADGVTVIDSIVKESNTAFVPHHQKFTFNFDVDFAYDLGPMLGYPRDCFFSVYAALNGVSTSFKPIAFSDKADDVLLWGSYIRFEPAIALTKKFYLLGLAGFENWRTQKSYVRTSSTGSTSRNVKDKAELLPIDFRDYAAGLGFDWDMLSRVGLHGRFKYMWHDDINFTENSFGVPVISVEIKTWF